MSLEKVQSFFASVGLQDRIKVFDESSATVEMAAEAIGCLPEHIAKTMSFLVDENPILIVMAGDAKVDNHKYKMMFHKKAKMIPWDDVESITGHAPGGVCPFAVNDGVKIYLDKSLRRFKTLYPAAGSTSSAVKLSLAELEQYTDAQGWVDTCKNWE